MVDEYEKVIAYSCNGSRQSSNVKLSSFPTLLTGTNRLLCNASKPWLSLRFIVSKFRLLKYLDRSIRNISSQNE